MQIFAHRGTSGHDPENTLRAFRGAIASGADGVEFDVHATADRVPIVIHDRDVGRTTSGRGHVDELTLEQVKALNAGDGEAVPTLDEALDVFGSSLRLYVELKQAGIEREVLETLGRHPGARWLVGSFDLDILRAIRTASSDAELWIIAVFPTDEIFAAAAELRATALSLHFQAISSDVMARCRANGLNLAAWTVNSIGDARSVRDLGVIALCTDYPAEIISGLRNGT